jgi:hypothetical protein
VLHCDAFQRGARSVVVGRGLQGDDHEARQHDLPLAPPKASLKRCSISLLFRPFEPIAQEKAAYIFTSRLWKSGRGPSQPGFEAHSPSRASQAAR